MKINRLLDILCSTIFCMTANCVLAQNLAGVTTKILEIAPREYGITFVIEASAAASLGTQGVTCSLLTKPAFSPTKLEYKTTRDAIFLAYTMGKTVTIYVDKTSAATMCLGGHVNTYAIDMLSY
jgi:hypothetical protein